MKKNKMMRAASALLVAVLLTTSVISGTFAKYVTTAEGTDSARVAKWGVIVNAKDFNMFKTDYETTDTSKYTGTYSVSSVDATERDNVLAPGTNGSLADITITGTPEVAVDVTFVGTVELSDNWKDDADNFYCPIRITNGTDTVIGLDYKNKDEFADAIEALINGKSGQYAPNTDLSTVYTNTKLSLEWEWDFEDATGSENTQNDVKDTFLGNEAAKPGNDLTITVKVEITVTQID